MCLMKCLSQDTSDEVFKSPGHFHVHRLRISGILGKAFKGTRVYNLIILRIMKSNRGAMISVSPQDGAVHHHLETI